MFFAPPEGVAKLLSAFLGKMGDRLNKAPSGEPPLLYLPDIDQSKLRTLEPTDEDELEGRLRFRND
jgi:hypothetical protein